MNFRQIDAILDVHRDVMEKKHEERRINTTKFGKKATPMFDIWRLD